MNELRNELNHLRMEEKDEENFDIVKGDFDEVVKRFESNTTKSYDFLLNAGVKYKRAMFLLCKRILDN